MIGYVKMFTSLDEDVGNHEQVTFGDNSKGKVVGLGKVAITKDLSISNILHVDSLSFNLLSIAQLYDLRLTCTFSESDVVVSSKEDKSLIFKEFRHGNIHLVDFFSNDAGLTTCLFTKTSLGWLWHRRIAHIGMSQLKKAFKRGMVVGVKDVKFEKDKLFSVCQAGKQFATSHPMKAYLSTSRPLELLHMDLFGPTTYKSLGGNLYCLVIVDDYSRYAWTFFLKDKGKMVGIFKTFIKKAQNEFKSSVVKVRSDSGMEFNNTQVEEFCDKFGINHEFSSTYTPQQNGVVERKNKTLITLARAMLDDYGISQRFWGEATNTACHASTQVYLHRFLKKTPYELLIGRKPNISYFWSSVVSATSSRKGSA
jgi:transposase InsO family protein